MRLFTKSFLAVLMTIILLASCRQNKPDEEENDRLKKENELLKKELVLNQKSSNQISKDPISEDSNLYDIEFLKDFHGKYPYEVKLLDNSIIKKRLINLIEDRFFFLKDTWAVETPIEIKNNIFVANACEAHNCNMTNFIIAINMSDNIMYVGIREEGYIKTYAENGDNFPEQIKEWASTMENQSTTDYWSDNQINISGSTGRPRYQIESEIQTYEKMISDNTRIRDNLINNNSSTYLIPQYNRMISEGNEKLRQLRQELINADR